MSQKLYNVDLVVAVHHTVAVLANSEDEAEKLADQIITRERIASLTTAEFSIGDIDAVDTREVQGQ